MADMIDKLLEKHIRVDRTDFNGLNAEAQKEIEHAADALLADKSFETVMALLGVLAAHNVKHSTGAVQ